MIPLKTREQLYEEYKDWCKYCRHNRCWHNYHPNGTRGYCYYERRVYSDAGCGCRQFVELTPIDISEMIEEYFESYEEHKKLILQ